MFAAFFLSFLFGIFGAIVSLIVFPPENGRNSSICMGLGWSMILTPLLMMVVTPLSVVSFIIMGVGGCLFVCGAFMTIPSDEEKTPLIIKSSEV